MARVKTLVQVSASLQEACILFLYMTAMEFGHWVLHHKPWSCSTLHITIILTMTYQFMINTCSPTAVFEIDFNTFWSDVRACRQVQVYLSLLGGADSAKHTHTCGSNASNVSSTSACAAGISSSRRPSVVNPNAIGAAYDALAREGTRYVFVYSYMYVCTCVCLDYDT